MSRKASKRRRALDPQIAGDLPFPEELVADRPELARRNAIQAADAVGRVGRLVDLDLDGAILVALVAESALLVVHGHPEKARLVEQAEDRPQGTNRPAERAAAPDET